MGKWLSIVEFSSKHGISISTLRRKIKNKKTRYKIDDGKYYIFENDRAKNSDNSDFEQDDDIKTERNNDRNFDTSENITLDDLGSSPSSDEILTFAEKSISTITKFHQETVDEKDKRLALQEHLINQLKEEIEELRMLVRVLENK